MGVWIRFAAEGGDPFDPRRPEIGGEGMTDASTPLKCKCGSRDLDLVEVIECSTLFRVTGGRLNRSEGYHEPDGYVRVEATCRGCGRMWRPKATGTRRSAIQITCVTKYDDEDGLPALKSTAAKEGGE